MPNFGQPYPPNAGGLKPLRRIISCVNRSGGTLEHGDVVAIDFVKIVSDEQVELPVKKAVFDTAPLALGVVYAPGRTIADDAPVDVKVYGPAQAKTLNNGATQITADCSLILGAAGILTPAAAATDVLMAAVGCEAANHAQAGLSRVWLMNPMGVPLGL